MSKRFFPEHQGDRKRAKLDISISDHNFPLSQNKDADNWGDDNDDEILLLASQACEQAYNTNDLSLLPDYSMCMQPGSTSTQLNPAPSTSKTEFTFKRPTAHPTSIISSQLKDKCNRISSPLPGITPKMLPKTNGHAELSDDDFLFSDKIFKGDADHTYRQLLQLQEQNAKLKSENGKLLEKCVTKEGEASILRTQLKSCQVSVDNARLEKIKAQEKVQMEWTDKLTAANNQMRDLRTQLDFKNLEIISIKEKCKKLESTKVKLTQVTVANNDISMSQRRQSINSSYHGDVTQSRRVKVASSGVQTEDKAKSIVLSKSITKETNNLSTILPFFLEPSPPEQSLIDYNDKLSRSGAPLKCRVYNTFHRIPSTPKIVEKTSRVQLSSVYGDLTAIAGGLASKDNYFNLFSTVKSALREVRSRLETISQRLTTALQKEMDERYIEGSGVYLEVTREDLLKGRALFKDEQEIGPRRLLGALAAALGPRAARGLQRAGQDQFLETISDVCRLLDATSCATLYSGLLLSIVITIQSLLEGANVKIITEIIKTLLTCRPKNFVVTEILRLVRKMSTKEDFMKIYCPGSSIGNLRVDYEQGVLLYKKDSCYLQILLKQVEASLKCIERQNLAAAAHSALRHLMALFNNMGDPSPAHDKSRCDCQTVLTQVIVYALRICAVMLYSCKNNDAGLSSSVLALCACAARGGAGRAAGGAGGAAEAGAGRLQRAAALLRTMPHPDILDNMLSELAGALQPSPEEMPPSFHSQPWLKSFENFSLTD